MKAVIINRYGSADVLKYTDISTPKINPDQVLVKIYASSVNPVDWKIRLGQFQLLTGYNFPKVLGSDLSGVVVEVGSQVSRFQVGDEVYTSLNPITGGAYAEYAAVPAATLALKPKTMTYEEAAAVPVAGLTALQGLMDLGQIRPGQKVLINGASGGVGTYAVQIAKAMQTEVTGVCSSANVEFVKNLGADFVIDYTQEDFTLQAKEYDIIFDTVAKSSFSACERILESDGVYISTLATPENMSAAFQTFFWPGKTAKLVLAQPLRRDLEALSNWIEAGKIKSILARTYTLSELAQAQTYSETGHVVGKVGVTVHEGVS